MTGNHKNKTTLERSCFVLGFGKVVKNRQIGRLFLKSLIYKGLVIESIRRKNQCRMICKPGSVIGDHSSAAFVAKRL